MSTVIIKVNKLMYIEYITDLKNQLFRLYFKFNKHYQNYLYISFDSNLLQKLKVIINILSKLQNEVKKNELEKIKCL